MCRDSIASGSTVAESTNIDNTCTTGHKFGLVYAGVGWLAFREK